MILNEKEVKMMNSLFIGPAGWHYQDWSGTVYPVKKEKEFSALSYIADYFNIVEINSTFYRIPSKEIVNGWIAQVAHKPAFQFSIKLYQKFTHEREAIDINAACTFMTTLQPLIHHNKLATVLVQFPWSFKQNTDTMEYLRGLMNIFRSLPLHFEFRHNSWMNAASLNLLRNMGAGFVNIDQPVIGNSIPPTTEVTSSVAYIRLHGRNYQNWFREGVGRDARYNYQYTSAELQEWENRIKEIAQKAEKIIVIFNNHFKGQAVVNSLQMMSLLFKKPINVPSMLLKSYPQLQSICSNPPQQTSLNF